jgi:hypothetical protein
VVNATARPLLPGKGNTQPIVQNDDNHGDDDNFYFRAAYLVFRKYEPLTSHFLFTIVLNIFELYGIYS